MRTSKETTILSFLASRLFNLDFQARPLQLTHPTRGTSNFTDINLAD